jgi:hypothetical protein
VRIDDPEVVRRQYASEEGLAIRDVEAWTVFADAAAARKVVFVAECA